MTSKLNKCECADTYAGEVFRKGRLRVVICKQNLQWIVQRQKEGAGARWKALGYCRTREGLVRVWATSEGVCAPETMAFLYTIKGWRK